MKGRLLAVAILCAGLVSLRAQAGTLPDDPSPYLGSGLADALAAFGAPASVAAARGPEAWQDDVVFEYPEGFSLYWYGNRLWQIGFAGGYPGSVFGLFLGDPVDKMVSLLGPPWRSTEENLVWRLPWKGYPVQLRVALRPAPGGAQGGAQAAGFYVLRADF